MKRLPRGTYIGGHQMSAIIGMHPYSSIGDVYAQCALGISGITDDEVDADPSSPNVLRRGKICEDGVIEYIERVCLGLPSGTLKRDVFVVDKDVPFFAGTIDAAEVDDDGKIVHVHEVTVTSTRASDAWGIDGDPGGASKYKWIQCQHYQGISGATGGTVWLFIADTGEIRRYPAAKKNSAIESMRNDAEMFWLEHVLPKIPPTIECESLGAWAVAETSIDAIYQNEDGGLLDSTAEIVKAANDYAEAREDVKSHEDKKRGSAAKIKSLLADHSASQWDGGRVSWKRNKPREKTDYEAAFKHLAQEQGLDGDELHAVSQKFTTKKDGPRILRVTIKAEKKDEEK